MRRRARRLIGSDRPLSGPTAIGYTYLDDANDPTKTLDDEKQLVMSDHVFAVFNPFRVITHQAVVSFLNTAHVPDLFVGSSCACWNQPGRHPERFMDWCEAAERRLAKD